MAGVEGPDVDRLGHILGPRWWRSSAGMGGVLTHGGAGIIRIRLARHGWEDAGGAGWSSHRFREGANPEGFVGGLDILDNHQLRRGAVGGFGPEFGRIHGENRLEHA